eukprot:1368823-Amorphochlora_amoeboformis.AAC.1
MGMTMTTSVTITIALNWLFCPGIVVYPVVYPFKIKDGKIAKEEIKITPTVGGGAIAAQAGEASPAEDVKVSGLRVVMEMGTRL